MRVVYIAHQLGNGPDRESNRRSASRYVAWAAMQGVAPVADWIVLSGEWEETPENRAKGMTIDLELVKRCDELWLCGSRISTGMREEASCAAAHGIPVIDMTRPEEI